MAFTSCNQYSENYNRSWYGYYRNKAQEYSWLATYSAFRASELCCTDSTIKEADSLNSDYTNYSQKANDCLDSAIKYAKRLP